MPGKPPLCIPAHDDKLPGFVVPLLLLAIGVVLWAFWPLFVKAVG